MLFLQRVSVREIFGELVDGAIEQLFHRVFSFQHEPGEISFCDDRFGFVFDLAFARCWRFIVFGVEDMRAVVFYLDCKNTLDPESFQTL